MARAAREPSNEEHHEAHLLWIEGQDENVQTMTRVFQKKKTVRCAAAVVAQLPRLNAPLLFPATTDPKPAKMKTARSVMEDVKLSDSKRRLSALLDKMDTCIGRASDEACELAFGDVSSFAREALTERKRRSVRQEPPDMLLFHMSTMTDAVVAALPLSVDVPVMALPRRCTVGVGELPRRSSLAPGVLARRSSAGLLGRKTRIPLPCCEQCSIHFQQEQVCGGCEESFRWCYTSYSRKPIEDPLYPHAGSKAFCGDCLRKRLPLSRVAEQDQEYLRIIDIFSAPSCEWKWVSCLCDCRSYTAVPWATLEGLLVLLLPFYCHPGLEHDDKAPQCRSPLLQDFVLGCAREALNVLSLQPTNVAQSQAWLSVVANPAAPANFQDTNFDFLWTCIANCLNTSIPTAPARICIWECKSHVFECVERYGVPEPLVARRVINILKFSRLVTVHCDLIAPLDVSQHISTIKEVDEMM